MLPEEFCLLPPALSCPSKRILAVLAVPHSPGLFKRYSSTCTNCCLIASSCPTLSAVCQAPLPTGFPRQGCQSGTSSFIWHLVQKKVEEERLDLQEEAAVTSRRAQTHAFILLFCFSSWCAAECPECCFQLLSVEVGCILLIEAGKWRKFGLKQRDHCEHLYHITSILGDSADTNEEKEKAPESL